jgi:hypothetical protein
MPLSAAGLSLTGIMNIDGTAIGFWMAEPRVSAAHSIWVSVRCLALAQVTPEHMHNKDGFHATFRKYRGRIEAVASDHFDALGPDHAGRHEGQPVITIWSLDP